MAYSLVGLGQALTHLGQLGAAERHLLRALALWEEHLGKEHPHLYWPLLELGELALARGRPAEALPWLERSLLLAQGVARAEVQLALAEALWSMGSQRPRALTLATEAQAYFQRTGHQPYLAKASRWLAEHR